MKETINDMEDINNSKNDGKNMTKPNIPKIPILKMAIKYCD